MIAQRRIGRPLTVPMRIEIAKLLNAGESRRNVAKALGVARRTVDKYAGLKNL